MRTSSRFAVLLVALASALPWNAFAGDVFTRITDLRPGIQSGVPRLSGLAHDDAFWFIGTLDDFDTRIYRYDGVNPPVEQVGTNVNPDELVRFGGEFVFRGGGLSDRELWRWNGVSAPTEAFDLLGSGSGFPEELTVVGDELCFDGFTPQGHELVCWDGLTTPTTFDIWTGSNGSDPDYLAAVGGKLYFEAHEPVFGGEPRVYDGAGAPALLADVRPGTGATLAQGFVEYEGDLYFAANEGSGQQHLFRKPPALPPVLDPNGLAVRGELAVHAGALFFPGFEEGDDSVYLHRYKDDVLNRLQPAIYYADGFLPFANALYFVAGDATIDRDIWRWCGSESVELVSDGFASNQAWIGEGGLVPLGGKLLLAANDGQGTGNELWSLAPMTAIFCSGFLPGDSSEWSAVVP
jgi:ELWxxDGT repeat protein